MKISEKICMDKAGLVANGPMTIVVFGDSVTQGAFGYKEMNYEATYWSRLRKKINKCNPVVPVNVINAGINGTSAKRSLDRMEDQVLRYKPDLLIVCFGLNDVNNPLEDYVGALREIFKRGMDSGAEVIFMTPNMLNTSVAEDTHPEFYEYAKKTAQMQNEGRFDRYIDAAVALAEEMGVTVCDCYKKWKELAQTQDTTYLLANRVNHPTYDMHELFAQSLFETIFGTEYGNVHVDKVGEEYSVYYK